MDLHIMPHELSLKYPFAISRHTYYSQPHVIIRLSDGGHHGYGEATLNPYYGITIENLVQVLEKIRLQLKHYHFTTPDAMWQDFSGFMPVNSFATAALNNAAWDLYGKLNLCPVRDFVELRAADPPMTSYTLGIDSQEMIAQKIADFPWPVYKIKLGTSDDIGLVKSVRMHTDSTLRVDANCAWTADDTIANALKLKELGVEYIEQPLPDGDPGQHQCFLESRLPLFADESCCTEADVFACANNFHGINIKLLKCGGLTPALRMISEARNLGLKIMIGCMTESSIGISAAAQLLPFVDFADLDGPLLITNDIAEGLHYERGWLHTGNGNGLGFSYSERV